MDSKDWLYTWKYDILGIYEENIEKVVYHNICKADKIQNDSESENDLRKQYEQIDLLNLWEKYFDYQKS